MSHDEPQGDAYKRADPSKFPTTEAGQRAAAEGTATGQGFTVQSAGDKLRQKMFELIEEYEEDRNRHRAQGEAAHGLNELAERYAKAKSYAERDEIAEQFGAHLSLSEAGLIRRVAKSMERALPDLIVEAHIGDGGDNDGMGAPEIARELGCSPRHAYQVIRDNPWEAPWIAYRAAGVDEWVSVVEGQRETTDTAEDVAEAILSEQWFDNDIARNGGRVCVWRTGDDLDPDNARAEATREADTQLDH